MVGSDEAEAQARSRRQHQEYINKKADAAAVDRIREAHRDGRLNLDELIKLILQPDPVTSEEVNEEVVPEPMKIVENPSKCIKGRLSKILGKKAK